ncbi:putative bifunctional diguanylate cyclase/phosphodiesterase [Actinomycetospora cinnamomea]|uniref:PAS domain S-box-containing protein/diguanylate cyclase (GGDEF)-like protein n=1 Tax=Actinomycetospora cinnamomea TaxID=663609 RepID=A0A2U1FRR6_9PSEU|nr:bifunctional diguanylate cyclase/phosphodiesterase [Actinomycetospora cinnamomea]PVZ14856.1 PAS domain S-box-containing protein/diguanylate cyclase (GGDEF)-like protein [Actinomycetospora cinnamomea]
MSRSAPAPGSRGLAVVGATTAPRRPGTRAPLPTADPAPAAALETALETAPLPPGASLRHDAQGCLVDVREQVARLVDPTGGLDPRRMLGRPVGELLADAAPGPDGLLVGRLRRVAAAPLPVRAVVWPERGGGAVLVLVLVPDATPAVPAAPVAPSAPSAADVERVAGLGHWEVDLGSGTASLSPVLAELLGVDRAAVRRPEDLLEAVHVEDRGGLARRWAALLADGTPLDDEVRLGDGSGRILHVNAGRRAVDGGAGTVLGTAADVTARRQAEERLRASTQRFTDLLAVAPVGIALFDDDERMIKANQALCRLLGQGPEALRGRRADELLDLGAEAAAGNGPVTPLLARPAGSAGSVSWSCSPRALRRRERGAGGADVPPVWCELHVSVSVHDDGGATHLVVFTDVTDARRVEASLRHQAMHDELTGLPNRRALTTTVSRLLAGPTARRTGVLFCDLDNFKRVNDSLGHDAGDELLVELAQRLRERLPAGCAASRSAGDEFVVVCADVDLHGGLDALSATVAGILRTAIPVHGQLVRISATVGAAVGATIGIGAGAGETPRSGARPPTSDPQADPQRSDPSRPEIDPTDDPVAQVLRQERATELAGLEPAPTHPGTGDLMRFADAALFEAKSGGNGRFALADEAIMRGADEALRMETQLREAMVNDELVLHFQPVVGPDGRVQTAEALVRWQHPEHGLLFPDKFLPVAEAADLLGDLDRWVLRAAVREAATWPSAGPGGVPPSVAVNLAGLLPGDPDFLPEVRAAVADAGLPWDRLVLELVETCLADLPPQTLREMNELIAAGVRFAVDDFGTGYSSLSRLTGLPAQIVKLDRGFVRGVATGESDRAVARAVVDLTAAIGQVCVAEGVEDADQFAVLRDLGVHAYQGWLFARAMPAEAFTEVLRRGPLIPEDRAAG